jgi:hypothetical protein
VSKNKKGPLVAEKVVINASLDELSKLPEALVFKDLRSTELDKLSAAIASSRYRFAIFVELSQRGILMLLGEAVRAATKVLRCRSALVEWRLIQRAC